MAPKALGVKPKAKLQPILRARQVLEDHQRQPTAACAGSHEAGNVTLRAGLFCIAAGLTTWGCPELGAFCLAAGRHWFMDCD